MHKLMILIGAKDMASGVVKGVGGSFGSLGKIATVGLGAATTGAVAAGGAILKLAKDAAPLEGVQKAFDGIAEASMGSAQTMLQELEKGSLGMVTQRDLMMTYNEAAQLVGTTFANQLPDAMGYLSKVSAATGQDMGFMLDSLVKGVGRLSPMILDNLGIQVNLSAATEKASEMFDKQADSLSKAEIQQGMMAVTLEKLEENTASMPDIAENASTKFAQMGVKMANLKDKIGLALIPIAMKMMDVFSGFAENVMPKVMDIVTKVVIPAFGKLEPIFKKVGGLITDLSHFFGNLIDRFMDYGWTFSDFFTTFEDGSSVLESFFHIFGLGEGVSRTLADAINTVVQTFLKAIEIGRTIGEVIWGIIQNLIHLVQWGEGMHVTEFMPGFIELPEAIQPIVEQVTYLLQDVVWWLMENIPKAIDTASTFFHETLLPALQAAGTFIVEQVLPVLLDLAAWLMENIPKAIQAAADFWTDVLQPVLEAGAAFLVDTVIPAIVEVAEFIMEEFGKVVQWVEDNWPLIQEAISDTMGTIQHIVETVIGGITDFWAEHGEQILSAVSDTWDAIKWAIDSAINLVLGIIQTVLRIIAGDWQGAWEDAKTAVSDAWGAIVAWLSTTAIPWLVETVGNVGGFLLEKGTEIIGKLWEGIKEQMPKVIAWLKDPALPDLVKTVGNIAGDMLDAGIELIGQLWQGLKDKMPEIIDWVMNVAGPWLVLNVKNIGSALLEAGVALMGDIWEGLKEKIPEVVTWVTGTAMPSIVTAVSGIGQALYNAGKAILQQLWDGLKAKWAEIWAWIQEKLAGIPDLFGLSEPKDPNSPLRNMAARGEWLMDEILKGLKKGMEKIEGEWHKFAHMISGFFAIGGAFGGLGGFGVDLFEQKMGDMQDTVEGITDAAKDMAKALGVQGVPKTWAQIQVSIADALGGFRALEHLRLREAIGGALYPAEKQQLALYKELLQLTEQRGLAMEELGRLSEYVIPFREAETQLGFLEQQWRLMETLKGYRIAPGPIFEGLGLGIGATMEDVITAMTRGMNAIIAELDKRIRGELPGMGLGPLDVLPGGGTITNNELTIYGGVTIQHVEDFGDFVGELELLMA